ncbi:tetratricopeptide (TPR) repeat protein [Kibdelosporangium banguiense]|uniref:Tetratricopeptide (TPR) repeat protein n=1 Tax=Kibdelosporangium banguiense TaxID=1365924 RepID=A0ABS4TSJ8_9PSEU|nr:tetratricopeptide repeat protein [Kibdelosporangium banguiense]MBP2327378.1 tetratricopeptide (TPR) repeat protein [Kibdelosporangium banguiense]
MDHEEIDHCSGGQPDAEGEVAVARLVMDSGDLPHALRHLADALALDPRLPDTHEALAEFVARAGGPVQALDYFEDEDGFIGTVAAHAHVCAAAGRWDEAIQMLLTVAAHEPDRQWLDVAWLQRTDLPFDPSALGIALGQMAQRLDDPVDEDEREPLLPALDLLRTAVAQHPGHAMLLWCGSMLGRRLGAFDEAIAWAEKSFQIEPSHQAAMMKGYALRTAGRTEEALAVWQDEIERTPQDLDLYIDVADLLGAMERPEEGLEWAERVVAQDPTHSRAVPTSHGLRYAIDGDVRHLITLADEVRDHPDSYAATVLANHSSSRPWLGVVPDAQEAVINVLRQVLEQNEPSPDVTMSMTLSALEPPSAFLTLHSVFPMANVDVDDVPEPDIRLPSSPVQYTVWSYDGKQARPALPPPTPQVAEAVQRVAMIRWLSPPEAYDAAITLSGLDPVQLMSVLTYPPAPTADELGHILGRHAPHLWVRAVQTWACLGIAHYASDEPWLESQRRVILADLLNGPEDWVTESAAFAMVVTAWVNPDARADVQQFVVRRMLDLIEASRTRDVTILASVCQLVLIIPGLAGEFAALAVDVLASLEAE